MKSSSDFISATERVSYKPRLVNAFNTSLSIQIFREFPYTMTYSFVMHCASSLLKYSVSSFFVITAERNCFIERCDILVVSETS